MSQPFQSAELKARLKALGLFGMIACWDEIADKPWLPEVLAIEEREKQKRSLERRLRNSRLIQTTSDWRTCQSDSLRPAHSQSLSHSCPRDRWRTCQSDRPPHHSQSLIHRSHPPHWRTCRSDSSRPVRSPSLSHSRRRHLRTCRSDRTRRHSQSWTRRCHRAP